MRPSPAMLVACLALFVALGGTSYAISQLPKNSVGSTQLKKNAVTSAKLRKSSVTSSKVKNGSLLRTDFKAGQLLQGPQGDKGDKGETGAPGATGNDGAKGSAKAYFAIRPIGPSVDPQASSANVLEVRRPSTGVYCVKLDPAQRSLFFAPNAPKQGSSPLILTVDEISTDPPLSQITVMSHSYNDSCGDMERQVKTYRAGVLVNNISFVGLIP